MQGAPESPIPLDFLLFGNPKTGTEKAPNQAKGFPSLTSLLKCISISMGSPRLYGRTEGYGVDGQSLMMSAQQQF